jgi:hypothetical protein
MRIDMHYMTRVTRWEFGPRTTRNERKPLAGRKIPFFFIKHLHLVQMFYEKEKKRTMLSQANRAITVRKRPVYRPSQV